MNVLLVFCSVGIFFVLCINYKNDVDAAVTFDPRLLENPNLFEGDIVLTNDQIAKKTKSKNKDGLTTFNSIFPNKYNLWPNKVIYYHNEMPINWQKRYNWIIRDAIADIESKTCIRFQQILNKNSVRDYINIFEGTGCWSYIGHLGGNQSLSLGPGCGWKGTVIHEFTHAIGFYHKHSQWDRDQYLNIHWNNIWANKTDQFDRIYGKTYVKTFDFMSIMLYGPKFFSINGKDTMTRKDGGRLMNVWDKPGLTAFDAYSINSLYGCRV